MTSADETAGVDSAAAVDQARSARADLRAALVALEDAAAAPAPHRLEAWAMTVHDALVDLGAAFERHIAVTEGPDGLLERIKAEAPRLVAPAGALVNEHKQLRERISETADLARQAAGSTDAGAADQVRQAVTDLMGTIVYHRQAGSDLVYEAYEVDIGAGD